MKAEAFFRKLEVRKLYKIIFSYCFTYHSKCHTKYVKLHFLIPKFCKLTDTHFNIIY